jgi:hypothetical protein
VGVPALIPCGTKAGIGRKLSTIQVRPETNTVVAP